MVSIIRGFGIIDKYYIDVILVTGFIAQNCMRVDRMSRIYGQIAVAVAICFIMFMVVWGIVTVNQWAKENDFKQDVREASESLDRQGALTVLRIMQNHDFLTPQAVGWYNAQISIADNERRRHALLPDVYYGAQIFKMIEDFERTHGTWSQDGIQMSPEHATWRKRFTDLYRTLQEVDVSYKVVSHPLHELRKEFSKAQVRAQRELALLTD